MTIPAVTPQQVRSMLLLREEIALLDLRHEAAYATGHPLFAANMAAGRIALEAEVRLPHKNVPIVAYDAGEGLVAEAVDRFAALGYSDIRLLDGGLEAWRDAGYEIFIDVNSYAKAFGELVEARRHTPSLSAEEVAALIASDANIRVLDVRRPDEYATMNIPGSVSVPGAELVLRAGEAAPDPNTTIVVNCAGRTRSIIGTQSLINAGIANKVVALRNGTIGWTLANQTLEHGADRHGGIGRSEAAKDKARDVAYRAGVKRIPRARSIASMCDRPKTLRPGISAVSVTIRAVSWFRRSTWRRRCAARAFCSPMP
jgi:rhodanese-related sulfurtransferase